MCGIVTAATKACGGARLCTAATECATFGICGLSERAAVVGWMDQGVFGPIRVLALRTHVTVALAAGAVVSGVQVL